MESIFQSAVNIPGYPTTFLLTLPLSDLINLCRTSKEFEQTICNEEFWEKKVKHDHPFTGRSGRPPADFETWQEYLIHRYELRRTIKGLIYRWLSLNPFTDNVRDNDDDISDVYSPRLWISSLSPGKFLFLMRNEYAAAKYNRGSIVVEDAIFLPSHKKIMTIPEFEQNLSGYLELIDQNDIRKVILSNHGRDITTLNYSRG